MKRPSILALSLAACAIPGLATAGTAVIEGGSGTDTSRMALEYRPGLLRMQPQSGEDGTAIVRDGKIYSIAGGMVIEISAVMGQLGQAMMQGTGTGPDKVGRFISLKNTGRTETVAGIKGEIHDIQYEDEDGQLVTEQMVLTRDKRAREMREALEMMATTLRTALQHPETAEEKKLAAAFSSYGMLRYGNDFRVISLTDDTPAASRFELPAAPTQLPDFGSLLGGASAGASAEAGSGGGVGEALGKLFGNQAERQQQRVEQRVENETDRTTDQAVDNMLDKAMDKLFGR